jgi:regulatory protein
MRGRTRNAGADDPEAEGPSKGGGKDLEAAAVRLLARRDHSTEELQRKLLERGYTESDVAAVVEKLTTKRLLSNDRYAASRVRHRAQGGHGPVRIRAELRQQGLTDEVIARELADASVDWPRLAADVRRRRFGPSAPRSLPERAKQARFLQYRGFSADQIRAALGGSDEPPASSDEPSPDWPD